MNEEVFIWTNIWTRFLKDQYVKIAIVNAPIDC